MNYYKIKQKILKFEKTKKQMSNLKLKGVLEILSSGAMLLSKCLLPRPASII